MRIAFDPRSIALAVLLAAIAPAGAAAAPPPPPEPPISDAARAAGNATICFEPTGTKRQLYPVLLVHGTALDSAESWKGTYERALPALGYETCTVDLPDYALDDIQTTSAPTIVAAIEKVFTTYGGPVNVITHSQGGLDARVALTYWPQAGSETRALVELAPDNHGTVLADAVCEAPVKQGCTASVQQQRTTSRLVAALDVGSPYSLSTSAGVTIVYTRGDEVVPETGTTPTSFLRGASNIAVQDICPTANPRHIDMLIDPIAFAVVLDALESVGATDASRIPKSVCALTRVSAFDRAAAAEIFAQSGNKAYRRFRSAPTVATEPALASYITNPLAPAPFAPGQIP